MSRKFALPVNLAAIGLRAHSGWAALVSLVGPAAAPVVISRKRLTIADPGFKGGKQPFHFVEAMPLSDAAAVVAECWEAATALAVEALGEEQANLQKKGFTAKTCGVIVGRTTDMPPLAKVLSSHPQLHTAEGIFFRQVLIHAAATCGLRVTLVPERGLAERAALQLGAHSEALLPLLTRMGHGLGSPWTIDQKYATAAAWLSLAGK